MREERIEVSGRVQGVGFRWWARREAEALGITGTVRNREDGTVEIQACGLEQELDAFCTRLREGPPTAQVEQVRRTPTDNVPREDFRIVR